MRDKNFLSLLLKRGNLVKIKYDHERMWGVEGQHGIVLGKAYELAGLRNIPTSSFDNNWVVQFPRRVLSLPQYIVEQIIEIVDEDGIVIIWQK